MPRPGRAAALRPCTAEPAQAASCPMLNPLPSGRAILAGFRGHRAGRARPHPPCKFGGGSARQKVEGGEYAALRGWGLKGRRKGLPPRAAIRAPPRPHVPGERPGWRLLPRRGASPRPAAPLVGGSAVPARRHRARPASCPAGSAGILPAAVRPAARRSAVRARFPSWETGPPRSLITCSLSHI